jgi:hypothetical protein
MVYSHHDLAQIQSFLDVPQFLLGDAAYTAGLSPTVLKAWLSRTPHIIELGETDTKPIGKGSARIFTLRRIVNISVTAELVRLGVTPKMAGTIGFEITDIMGRPTELSPNLKATRPGVKNLDPTDVNIWARNDVLIVGNKSSSAFHVLIGDVLAFEMLQRLSEVTKGGDIHSCLIIDFSGIYQNVLEKLKERVRLS